MFFDCVREYHHSLLVKSEEAQARKYLIHHELKGQRSVHLTKRNDLELKTPKRIDERRLLLTIFTKENLTVYTEMVDGGEDLSPFQVVNELLNFENRAIIHTLVQLQKIHTKPRLTVFISCYRNGEVPCRRDWCHDQSIHHFVELLTHNRVIIRIH